MNHDSVVERFQGLVANELGDEERREVEVHLESCADCRELSRAYEEVREALGCMDVHEPTHPSPAEIVAFAMGPDTLVRPNREAIEVHLRDCLSCRDEIRRVRTVEGDPGAAPYARLGSGWPGWRLGVAAAVLFAAIGYPAYRLLAPAPLAGSAVTTLQLVRSPLRGSEGSVLILDGPVVVLGVDLLVPEEVKDAELIRFELLNPSGEPAVALDTTAGEARRQIREPGVVTLMVATREISPGIDRLTFRATIPNAAGRSPLLETVLAVDDRR